MQGHKTRSFRPWSMSASAAAVLAVTSAAFAGGDTSSALALGSKDRLFRQLDLNRDGTISRAESAREPGFAKGFDESDEDGDGRLNAREFTRARALYQRAALAELSRDSLISAKVKATLLRDPRLGGLDLDVKTQDGIVLLTGKVVNPGEAEHARNVARGVNGVVAVRDELVTLR
jgi:hypothetical protein